MASALLGIAKPLAGSILGGIFGGRGSKTSSKMAQDLTRTTKGQSMLESMFKNMLMPVEDPLITSFRQSLLPLMAQEYNRIQTPLYGPGAIANQLQSIQGRYNNASDLIMSKLASVGALDSGRTAQVLTDIGQQTAGEQAKFLSGLPFQEEQARRSGLAQMFALMSNLTGRAHVGQVGSGSQQQKQQTEETMKQHGVSQGEATTSTGGFGSNLAGNLAKGLGMGSFDPLFDTMRGLIFDHDQPEANFQYGL